MLCDFKDAINGFLSSKNPGFFAPLRRLAWQSSLAAAAGALGTAHSKRVLLAAGQQHKHRLT